MLEKNERKLKVHFAKFGAKINCATFWAYHRFAPLFTLFLEEGRSGARRLCFAQKRTSKASNFTISTDKGSRATSCHVTPRHATSCHVMPTRQTRLNRLLENGP